VADTKTRRRLSRSTPRKFITRIELDKEEASVLVRVATYHQKAIGPVRFLVQLVAPEEIRDKYTFVKEETKVLKQFAREARDSISRSQQEREPISFTPRTLVAFWGRMLASLKTKRSRRKLSMLEIERREALARRLEAIAGSIWQDNRKVLEQELATRRLVEAEWMRERLEARDS
jgi:hypothetical protein